MFSIFKSKKTHAIEQSTGIIRSLIDGLKALWFGTTNIKLSDLSNVLDDPYAQGFLFAIADQSINLTTNKSLSNQKKGEIILKSFGDAFGVEFVVLKPWFSEIIEKLHGKAEPEFVRGVKNGTLLARFVAHPNLTHSDADVQDILLKARLMPDPQGWLIAELWFQEMQRLRPDW
ncbi:MAG TPA: hypothetical protein VMY41_08720 [Thermohalobaculum sp.]|nr:hypothetical protein [Thermohalobaculum sp.]